MRPMDNRNAGMTPNSTGPRHEPGPKWLPRAVTIGFLAIAALAVAALPRFFPTSAASEALSIGGTDPESAAPLKLPDHLFRDWDKATKPDLVILLSAQQHGYLLPCGCSRPQKGGLERRYNLAELLRERFGALASLDLGDIAQRQGPSHLPNEQGKIKYRYSMEGLREIGYEVAGIGEFEASLPLEAAIGEWALNENDAGKRGPQVLCANLVYDPPIILPWKQVMTKGSALRLGVTSVVGNSQQKVIADQFKRDPVNRPKFTDENVALDGVLKEMGKEKLDLNVLLYHGYARPTGLGKAEAVLLAEKYPQFPLMLCLSQEDEPSSNAVIIKNPKTKAESMLIGLGHKGKFVGVVGVWKTGNAAKPFDFRYQLVELTEEFLTPAGKERDNPITKRMEKYTAELKSRQLSRSISSADARVSGRAARRQGAEIRRQ